MPGWLDAPRQFRCGQRRQSLAEVWHLSPLPIPLERDKSLLVREGIASVGYSARAVAQVDGAATVV